ncbi:tripartite tricarboxylate transporter substrate binding protein [Pigmentiphaga soli]|uniref:Tripartite tricarboxylate transporter substrate binding protein n=1 Tax=Pigmentiphaga soli TaxID=1007095 RepID=A0ABP8H1N7_9BURK
MKPMIPLLALALLGHAAISAAAPGFPDQPVNLIVNFPPAGLTDLAGRALAQAMSEQLRQTVVVQNRGGAGGAIGVAAVAAAPKNGYSAGFVAVAALTTLPQMREVPYSLDSFDYVCRTFDEPVYLLVAPDSPFHTAKALVDYAKAHPGKLNYATVGPGSLPHLAALDFVGKAGIEMAHIPYQGEAPAVTALLGKQVEVYFGTSAVASSHNLRRLGVAAQERIATSPETPTLGELGYPVRRSILGGIIAPRGVAPAARQVLENACAQATQAPRYKSALKTIGVSWAYSPGADFKSMVLADAARNRLVLREANLLIPSSNSQ